MKFPDDWCTPAQREIFEDQSRFRLINAGRRFGKTYLAVYEIARAASTAPAYSKLAYFAPTRDKAKELGYTHLMRILNPKVIEKWNENELMVLLKNGTRIYHKGSDSADHQIRGLGLVFAVCDEIALFKERTLIEVILPTLSDNQGGLMAISTPRGYNWWYKFFMRCKAGELGPEFKTFEYTTLEGGNVPESELNLMKSVMSPAQFAQEYLAGFGQLGNRVYTGFTRQRNVADHVVDIPSKRLMIGLDFNVNPMVAVLGIDVAGCLHIFEEIVIHNGNTTEMAERIVRDYGDKGRLIDIYPDASGRFRSTASAGQTNFTILEDHGLYINAGPSNPPVQDRINEVNRLCCDATGKSRLFIHPRCERLIMSLEGQTWKEETSKPDKSGNLDHANDALGYLVHMEYPLIDRDVSIKEFAI